MVLYSSLYHSSNWLCTQRQFEWEAQERRRFPMKWLKQSTFIAQTFIPNWEHTAAAESISHCSCFSHSILLLLAMPFIMSLSLSFSLSSFSLWNFHLWLNPIHLKGNSNVIPLLFLFSSLKKNIKINNKKSLQFSSLVNLKIFIQTQKCNTCKTLHLCFEINKLTHS